MHCVNVTSDLLSILSGPVCLLDTVFQWDIYTYAKLFCFCVLLSLDHAKSIMISRNVSEIKCPTLSLSGQSIWLKIVNK